MSNDGLDLGGLMVMAAIMWASYSVVTDSGSASESIDGQTENAFADASLSVMQSVTEVAFWAAEFVAIVLGGTLTLGVALFALAAVTAGYRNRKRWNWRTFGRRKDHRTLHKQSTDKRCVNCYGEIDGHTGIRNVATENTVLFGFAVREHERVETFECADCHEADFYDYAMRADKHEEAMFTPDLESAETDTESEEDESSGVDCPACDTECKNDHGLRVHWGQTHPETDLDEYKSIDGLASWAMDEDGTTESIPDSERVQAYRDAAND